MSLPEERCELCKYIANCQCHRNAPVSHFNKENNYGMAIWPSVNPHWDWCGEFERKIKKSRKLISCDRKTFEEFMRKYANELQQKTTTSHVGTVIEWHDKSIDENDSVIASEVDGFYWILGNI